MPLLAEHNLVYIEGVEAFIRFTLLHLKILMDVIGEEFEVEYQE